MLYHLKMKNVWESYRRYFLPTVEIKDYNVIIDRRNFSNQPVKNNFGTYNIQKIVTGQVDDYTTRCLLDCTYFKKYYKLITIDLSKQQKLDADPKAIQQINFIGNRDRAGNTQMFFIIKEAKKSFRFFKRNS